MSQPGGFATPGTSGSAVSGGMQGPSAAALATPAGGTSASYKMRGLNTLNVLVVWVVQGTPDLTGAQYTGPNTPLSGITIAARS